MDETLFATFAFFVLLLYGAAREASGAKVRLGPYTTGVWGVLCVIISKACSPYLKKICIKDSV